MSLLLDAGTSWSKVISLKGELDQLKGYEVDNISYTSKLGEKFRGNTYILPSAKLRELDLKFDYLTGHNTKTLAKDSAEILNEILALAYGALKIDKNLTGTVLDIGSRDTKTIEFKDGVYKDLDWNSSCGSSTGATLEMLLSFYGLKLEDLSFNEEKYSITCGIFAMEKIMDDIANGIESKVAIAKFIHGLAYNAYKFAGNPHSLYLSGGFCQNSCFIDSLNKYTKVQPLGRFVLLNGLY